MTLRFAEIQTFVSDLERSRAFYEGLLGLHLRQDAKQWLIFDLDGVELVMVGGALPQSNTEGYGARRATVICLACGDIHAERERLILGGARFLTEVVSVSQGLYAAFEDPDGNLLELIESGAHP